MKKQITTLTVTFILFIILTLVFVFANDVKAQEANAKIGGKVVIEKYELPSNSVKSLISGIKSDNEGLKKSSIFYAGQYRLDGTVDCLIEELKREDDPEIKVLIVLSLYKIGNPVAIEYIKEIVANETNTGVKNMVAAVYDDFVITSSLAAAQR